MADDGAALFADDGAVRFTNERASSLDDFAALAAYLIDALQRLTLRAGRLHLDCPALHGGRRKRALRSRRRLARYAGSLRSRSRLLLLNCWRSTGRRWSWLLRSL